MKILIAVPTFENISVECFKAIYDLDKCEHDVTFTSVKGYDCAKARNVISKKAIDGAYDYVLMIDSDTIVPQDALRNMLEGDADLVLGCVPKKSNPNESVLFSSRLNKKGEGFHSLIPFDELCGTDRIDLKGGGFGCALLNTKVFAALKYPYFKYVSYESGSALSEDLYFCRELKNAGFKIECDPRVKCGHLAKHVLHGE